MADKVSVKIPEKAGAKFPSGELGLRERFERIDTLMWGIIVVLVLTLISIVVSIFGLFLDQFRSNSVVYREYAQKMEINNTLMQENKELKQATLESQTQNRELLQQILDKK